MLNSMQQLLEDGFDVLNKVYFNNELPPIVITIMSSPRTNGHFTCSKVWRKDTERMHEINISSESLNRKIENIMATMLHEMCHYYASLKSISDVSSNGRYHNKKFKEIAEQRDLKISYAPYIGWSVTEPTEKFIDVIKSHGIEKPIDINRDGSVIRGINGGNGLGSGGDNGNSGTDGVEMPKKKTSTRTYKCPSCGNSFRATKNLRVLCMDCLEEFVKVKPEVS